MLVSGSEPCGPISPSAPWGPSPAFRAIFFSQLRVSRAGGVGGWSVKAWVPFLFCFALGQWRSRGARSKEGGEGDGDSGERILVLERRFDIKRSSSPGVQVSNSHPIVKSHTHLNTASDFILTEFFPSLLRVLQVPFILSTFEPT